MSIFNNKENQAPEAKWQKMFHGMEMQNLDSSIRASARFFSLPELVEMTILHITAIQILLIQRTNKKFRDTVHSCVAIQRKLFFQHDPHKSDVKQIEANPFLHSLGTDWSIASTSRVFGNITTKDMERYNHPAASWRKMLVSIPTGKRLVIARINPAKDWGQAAVLVANENGSGLRMLQVADHVWGDEGQLSTLIQMEVEM